MISGFFLAGLMGIATTIISWFPTATGLPSGVATALGSVWADIGQLNQLFPVDTVIYLTGQTLGVYLVLVWFWTWRFGITAGAALKKIITV